MIEFIKTVNSENIPSLCYIKEELYILEVEINPISFFSNGSVMWFKSDDVYNVYNLKKKWIRNRDSLDEFVNELLNCYRHH